MYLEETSIPQYPSQKRWRFLCLLFRSRWDAMSLPLLHSRQKIPPILNTLWCKCRVKPQEASRAEIRDLHEGGPVFLLSPSSKALHGIKPVAMWTSGWRIAKSWWRSVKSLWNSTQWEAITACTAGPNWCAFHGQGFRMFRLMIRFASCSKIDKAHEWGTFPRCRARLGYHIVLGPLMVKYPPWGFTPHYSVNPNRSIL